MPLANNLYHFWHTIFSHVPFDNSVYPVGHIIFSHVPFDNNLYPVGHSEPNKEYIYKFIYQNTYLM